MNNSGVTSDSRLRITCNRLPEKFYDMGTSISNICASELT